MRLIGVIMFCDQNKVDHPLGEHLTSWPKSATAKVQVLRGEALRPSPRNAGDLVLETQVETMEWTATWLLKPS